MGREWNPDITKAPKDWPIWARLPSGSILLGQWIEEPTFEDQYAWRRPDGTEGKRPTHFMLWCEGDEKHLLPPVPHV